MVVAALVLPALAAAQSKPICSPSVQDPSRVALVIGKAAHGSDGWSKLANADNDAEAMPGKLCELGFDVRLYRNADLSAFNSAPSDFRDRLERHTSPVGFF